jgi:hypothetical protein
MLSFFFSEHGTCKHCVALLFALANFNDRHKDRHTLVGTDLECKWDKPKKTTEPMEIDKIDIRIDRSSRPPMVAISKNYRPMADLHNKSQREIEKKMYKLCKNTGAVLLQTLDPPSDESDIENDLPDAMLDIAISVQYCEDPINMFETKIKTAHTDDTINTIEEITRGQTENPEWFNFRRGRITASLFPSVANFGFSDNPDNYIVKQIMNENKDLRTPAISCNNVAPVTNLCLGRATTRSHSSQWSKKKSCS